MTRKEFTQELLLRKLSAPNAMGAKVVFEGVKATIDQIAEVDPDFFDPERSGSRRQLC